MASVCRKAIEKKSNILTYGYPRRLTKARPPDRRISRYGDQSAPAGCLQLRLARNAPASSGDSTDGNR
jgi:hypothetical protein